MLFAVSGLMGCAVEASDGEVGVVKDLLFDDQTWTDSLDGGRSRSLGCRAAAGCSSIRRQSLRWRCRQSPTSR